MRKASKVNAIAVENNSSFNYAKSVLTSDFVAVESTSKIDSSASFDKSAIQHAHSVKRRKYYDVVVSKISLDDCLLSVRSQTFLALLYFENSLYTFDTQESIMSVFMNDIAHIRERARCDFSQALDIFYEKMTNELYFEARTLYAEHADAELAKIINDFRLIIIREQCAMRAEIDEYNKKKAAYRKARKDSDYHRATSAIESTIAEAKTTAKKEALAYEIYFLNASRKRATLYKRVNTIEEVNIIRERLLNREIEIVEVF